MTRPRWSQPFAEHRDLQHRLVADGQLVIAGGDGTVSLEPVNAALHGVPVLVAPQGERGGPPANRGAAGPVARRSRWHAGFVGGPAGGWAPRAHGRAPPPPQAPPPRRARPTLQPGHALRPGPIPLPAAEQPIKGLPGPVTGRQAPPRRAGPG